MAITLIHGSNGGYKSSRAVQDFIVPALEEGRVVVTNIRGVNLQRCYDQGVDVHPDSDVIYIDTDNTPEGKIGRQLIGCFWHWCPHDALLVFDEAGVVFPKAWRDRDLQLLQEQFIYLKDVDQLRQVQITDRENGRPASFIEAFEMHRHYGWDIVLSAPSIKSVRDDIRNTTELAWRHRNAALVGLNGRYKAVSHQATNNGETASAILETKISKIKPRTFKLYDSTKTGKAKDTANAGKALLGSPRLLLAMGVLAGALYYLASYSSLGVVTGDWTEITNISTAEDNSKSVQVSSVSSVSNVSNSISGQSADRIARVEIYGHPVETLNIAGRIGDRYIFEAKDQEGNHYEVNLDMLYESGYYVVGKTDCHVLLVTTKGERSVYCKLARVMSDEEYEEYLESLPEPIADDSLASVAGIKQ